MVVARPAAQLPIIALDIISASLIFAATVTSFGSKSLTGEIADKISVQRRVVIA